MGRLTEEGKDVLRGKLEMVFIGEGTSDTLCGIPAEFLADICINAMESYCDLIIKHSEYTFNRLTASGHTQSVETDK